MLLDALGPIAHLPEVLPDLLCAARAGQGTRRATSDPAEILRRLRDQLQLFADGRQTPVLFGAGRSV